MIRDYKNWKKDGDDKLVVYDTKNGRYFMRPLTFNEKNNIVFRKVGREVDGTTLEM